LNQPEVNHILSIDAGTQSLRAMIFDCDGHLIAKHQVHHDPPEEPAPGWCEQNVTDFWSALVRACQALWQHPDVDRKRLAAVSVTSQRGTTLCLDAHGEPLRPAILWLDQRRCQGLAPIGGLQGLAFRLAGVHHTISNLQAKAASNWIRTCEPDIWNKTQHFLLVSGYLNFRLTGKYHDSHASQVAYLPFDYKSFAWAHSSDWRWGMLGIQPSQLPTLFQPGQTLGTVSQQAATATGIPSGLPVIAAAADKACEVLGSGCLSPSAGHLSFGTAATFNITSPHYFEAEKFIPPYPAAIPNHYSVESQIFRGFWMVTWFLKNFGHLEKQRAQEASSFKPANPNLCCPETYLEELLHQTSPGCDGLMLQPYWSPGIKTPGPEARGSILGFQAHHGRAHLYRALIEGLLLELFAAGSRIQRRGKLKLGQLACSGGGSQSDGIMQIAADVFGLPSTRPHVYETSGLGAAMIAAVGLGLVKDFPEAISKMTRPGKVFQPRADAQRIYARLYAKYQKIYPRLKTVYSHMG